MPVVPTISVGSQQLFNNLLAGSVPLYRLNFNPASCGGGGTGCGAADDAGEFGGSGGSTGSGGGDGGGPTVVLQETVGAFDVTVLQGGTAHEVEQWLEDNGYGSTAETPALLADYVKQSYVFVAVKLAAGAGVDQIQPIVLRYASNMPCVPIRLTRVAAVDNMGIRAFFLGKNRVYPENYALVDLNEAQIDWVNGAPNYDLVVSHALDEAPAHRGFVVEYAGDSSVISQNGLFDARWSEVDFTASPPDKTVVKLADVGLANCTNGKCTFSNPLLLPLLRQYLPPQGGVPEGTWYAQLEEHAGQIDSALWNGPAFEKDYKTRIVEPGQHAATVLAEFPKLTRLLTKLSPAEMTLDPTFVARPDLDEPDVPRVRTAREDIPCEGDPDVALTGLGKIVVQGPWPKVANMPFALRVRTMSASGPPTVVVDNLVKIAGLIGDWNDAHGGVVGNGCSTGSAKRAPAPLFLVAALGALALRRRSKRRRR